ncbi:MAG TPA: amidohydrolase family protein [Casimicrobiaceae bacterium]|jgi:imidazolonepropionase-like amidohydrolase
MSASIRFRAIAARFSAMFAAFVGSALVALAIVAAPADGQVIAITGGRVFPVSGPPIDNGTVIIRDGEIAQVGANIAVPANAQRVDATGKWVTPGLIDAATQLGLFDVGFGGGPTDNAARGRAGDGITPSFSAWEGVNPRSVYIGPARQGGVTSVITGPSGTGLISGQTAVVDLVDGTVTDMLLKAPAAMLAGFDLPVSDKIGARAELYARMRELIEDTKSYMRNRASFERNQTRAYSIGRADLEAMIPVVEGKMPLAIQASRASDIEAAIKFAKDNSLKLLIVGGAEAWQVANALAAAKVPVLAGAMNNIPTQFNALGQRQENAGLLRAAGVSVAIIGNNGDGDEEQFNIRNIRQEAGNAIAYGLPWAEGLRATTLSPAEMFGVADRVGSLQPGREANVVIWSGDPFELSTVAEHVWVRGRESTAPTRQDMLEQRYKTLPPDYKRP